MSITKQKGTVIHFQCDHCNRKLAIYFGDFEEGWTSAKKDGWRCYKDDTGAWCHECPDCAKENS